MLTSAQRKALRGMANTLNPIFQVGKNGITQNLILDISNALDAHELIKVTVLKNSDLDPKYVLNEICDQTNADPVGCVGSKIVLYRFSTRDKVNHIEI